MQAASAAAEMEELRRTRRGLPTLPASAGRRAAVESAADDADAAAERARLGLMDLGRQRIDQGGGVISGASSTAVDLVGQESVHITAGRQYITSMTHDSLPLGYLQVGCGDRIWG